MHIIFAAFTLQNKKYFQNRLFLNCFIGTPALFMIIKILNEVLNRKLKNAMLWSFFRAIVPHLVLAKVILER